MYNGLVSAAITHGKTNRKWNFPITSAVQAQNSNSERQREIYDYYYADHMICSQLSNELETNNESAVAMDQVIR